MDLPELESYLGYSLWRDLRSIRQACFWTQPAI
jgi:hypothetical protein